MTSSCDGQVPPLAFIGFFDCLLVGGKGEVGAVGLPFGIILMRLLVPGDKFLCQGRSVRIREIESVVPKQHSFRRELLLHQRVLPTGCRKYKLGTFG